MSFSSLQPRLSVQVIIVWHVLELMRPMFPILYQFFPNLLFVLNLDKIFEQNPGQNIWNKVNKESTDYKHLLCKSCPPWGFMQVNYRKYRSSHQRCSIKKAVFKNFLIFTGKHLLRNFSEHLCWRTSENGCFCKSLSLIKIDSCLEGVCLFNNRSSQERLSLQNKSFYNFKKYLEKIWEGVRFLVKLQTVGAYWKFGTHDPKVEPGTKDPRMGP